MKRTLMLIGAVVLFAAASYFLFGPGGNSDVVVDAKASPGETDGFTVTTLAGNEFSLAEHNGDVVLVNFWATWCGPCRLEIPHFTELYNEYGDNGLQIIGVSVDRKGESVVRDWLQENDVSYPIAMGDDGVLFQRYQQLIEPAQRGGIPYTVIFDADGNVAETLVGYRDKEQWWSILGPMLEEAGG
ncbi:MAG: Thiol-disulfide oxidoreductase ResA [Calditrichaeota bacterium]|nr:Thiol-disulfide oxidoreductase ResA [Calditrichota bacterium]